MPPSARGYFIGGITVDFRANVAMELASRECQAFLWPRRYRARHTARTLAGVLFGGESNTCFLLLWE